MAIDQPAASLLPHHSQIDISRMRTLEIAIPTDPTIELPGLPGVGCACPCRHPGCIAGDRDSKNPRTAARSWVVMGFRSHASHPMALQTIIPFGPVSPPI